MKEVNTVIFDMDGVIFDTERCYLLCWKELEEKYQIGNMDEMIYKCIGTNEAKTKEICLSYLGQDFPYDTFMNDMYTLFNTRYGECPPKKEGIEELLQYLKKNNYKIGLASSTRKEVVIKELTNTNLVQYFDEIVGGDMVNKSKPEPDIYLKACELLKEAPEHCIAIEDSFNGIRSAYKANMHPIMVPDLIQPDEEIKTLSSAVLKDLYAVIQYLEQK